MGIDFGAKRVGLALSDSNKSIAFPNAVLPNDDSLLPRVLQVIKSELVDTVVIGESLDNDGVDNPIMAEARAFAGALEGLFEGRVVFEQEAMTSAHVSIGKMMQTDERRGKQTFAPAKDSDASAAALILQRFLDKIQNHDNSI